MLKNVNTTRCGFTLVELMVTSVVSVIVILCMGVVIADSHKGWNSMYTRFNADIVSDSYVVKRVFDSVVRKSSWKNVSVDNSGQWVQVHSYAAAGSNFVDRYARFYFQGGELHLDRGNYNSGENNPEDLVSTQVICSDVTSCVFTVAGRSVMMVLQLDDGDQAINVSMSSLMHNR